MSDKEQFSLTLTPELVGKIHDEIFKQKPSTSASVDAALEFVCENYEDILNGEDGEGAEYLIDLLGGIAEKLKEEKEAKT